VGGRFARVQCTPDLLPRDITGFSIVSGTFLTRLILSKSNAPNNMIVANQGLSLSPPRSA
jgi:hypothetical protein